MPFSVELNTLSRFFQMNSQSFLVYCEKNSKVRITIRMKCLAFFERVKKGDVIKVMNISTETISSDLQWDRAFYCRFS